MARLDKQAFGTLPPHAINILTVYALQQLEQVNKNWSDPDLLCTISLSLSIQSIYLSIYLYICIYFYVSICLCIYLSISPSIIYNNLSLWSACCALYPRLHEGEWRGRQQDRQRRAQVDISIPRWKPNPREKRKNGRMENFLKPFTTKKRKNWKKGGCSVGSTDIACNLIFFFFLQIFFQFEKGAKRMQSGMQRGVK